MIRLGLEPKTYCLEGSCSIQLSYRTSLVCDLSFGKSAAKVVIFSETAKLLGEILFFCGLPVAVNDLAVMRLLVDVDTDIAGKSTYIEVLVIVA